MPKFKTKAGRLTRYSLMCGYIEETSVGTVGKHKSVKLYMENTHIEVFRFDNTVTPQIREWDGELTTMKKARRVFAQRLKEFGLTFPARPAKANPSTPR